MEAREQEQTKRKQSRRLQKSFISSGANWLCGRDNLIKVCLEAGVCGKYEAVLNTDELCVRAPAQREPLSLSLALCVARARIIIPAILF